MPPNVYVLSVQIKDLQEQQEKERVARGISNAEKLLRAELLREERILEIKRKVGRGSSRKLHFMG